jgi:RNA polymerase sigma-70 factor (ECF subfamily)
VNGASDEELLDAHVHGDRGAFGQLVARHERRVYGVCLRLLGSREDAEDATQEAFLAALRRAASFRGEAAFSTWLFRIAINAATDQARRRGRARAVPLEPEELVAAAPSGGDPGGAVPNTLAIQAALRRVPEDFRAVLVLCDLYGFPYAQAAEILRIPVGTVKSRMFRARLALGKHLAAPAAAPGRSPRS